MPRQSRIDSPGCLHHVIVRGIARNAIFSDDADRDRFLARLGGLLVETGCRCYAWALIPNHFHLLLKTGHKPVSTLMRRLLTGYAMMYNRRHDRCGHVFQNRYKSILCQQDAYLLELVRYIHLNPLRAGLVKHMGELDYYPYAGHSVVMGERSNGWQEVDEVLGMFGERVSTARTQYRQFVEKGIDLGSRPELTGGGLIRSMGGWSAVKALRKKQSWMKGDERVLGGSDFVNQMLSKSEEALERRYRLQSRGMDMDGIAARVSKLMGLPVEEVWSPGKRREVVRARSVLCFWAVRELRISMTEMARRLELSPAAVSLSVLRGEKIVSDNHYALCDE
ncbi:MAG: transposase [Desulfobacterales bacterium]|nr:transposase [Desulfobacterales bacterium]